MSDKLAPLMERRGPWLLQVSSSCEDPQAWAAYVKLEDRTREYLRKIRKHVEQLQHEEGFKDITYWAVGDIRFLSQGIPEHQELSEYVTDIVEYNTEELLVPERWRDIIENLETLRTDCDCVHCNASGIWWSAQDHYSSTLYTTSTLDWSDI